jgi:hypothetical protein
MMFLLIQFAELARCEFILCLFMNIMCGADLWKLSSLPFSVFLQRFNLQQISQCYYDCFCDFSSCMHSSYPISWLLLLQFLTACSRSSDVPCRESSRGSGTRRRIGAGIEFSSVVQRICLRVSDHAIWASRTSGTMKGFSCLLEFCYKLDYSWLAKLHTSLNQIRYEEKNSSL